MPLVCQTRVDSSRRGPQQALQRGEAWLAEAALARQAAIWIAWRNLGALRRVADHLPEGFDGFWMDVTASADAPFIDRYCEWARTLRGGSIRVQCLEPDHQNEVTLELGGEPARTVDDDALDPRRPYLRARRGLVTYQERSAHGGDEDSRLELAAGRVQAAYERLATVVSGCPPLEAEIDKRWSRVAAFQPRNPWAALPDPVEATPSALRLQTVDGVPDALHVEFGDARDAQVAAFRAWLGLAHQLDVVVLRCTGTLEQLEDTLDVLDLDDDNPERPHNVFGVTTVGRDGLDPETLMTLADHAQEAADWGVRWSGIRWRLEDDPAPGSADQSYYYVRTDRSRTYDNLLVSLDQDDPEDERFRRARRQLARLVNDDLGLAAAWSFEGPTIESARGQLYSALVQALHAEVATVLESPEPIPARPPRQAVLPLRALRNLMHRGHWELDVLGAARRALQELAPGFRHDRRAHATDHYFLDFVRGTPNGYQYIQVRRTHRVPGHAVRVGVSRYRARLDELDPGIGRVTHGLALPLEALVPERDTVEWSYSSQRECERAMGDMARLVAARALPFFERTEAALARFRQEEK